MSEDNNEIEFSKFHKNGRDILNFQARALEILIHDLHSLDEEKTNMSIRVPILMLQAIGVSIHSVLALTIRRDMNIRDCFGIARSAAETALNAAFIAVKGEHMAQKAIRHMSQKRWRDLRRKGKAGRWYISVERNVSVTEDEVPGLREALAEYTNKRGEEIRDWTSESIENRIEIVSEKNSTAGFCLGMATSTIYRPASEILHGTFYSIVYFWQGGGDKIAKIKTDFDKLWTYEHFITILSTLFFAASGAIEAISSVHNLQGHSERQNNISEMLRELVENIEGVH